MSAYTNNYNFSGGLKEMVIDFVCREDLVVTTLREFFEVLIASIKKEQVFHKEILNPKYNAIGVSILFDNHSNIGTLRVLLGYQSPTN